MNFIRFYGIVFREGVRHSLDIAQAVIFVLLICAGLFIKLYPSAKTITESANLTGWEVAAYVLCAIVIIRMVFAPYWLFKDHSLELGIAKETLLRISDDRPFSYVGIAPSVIGNDFNKTPIWKIQKLYLIFRNISDRNIFYKFADLFLVYEGNKMTISLPSGAGGYIQARQEISYGFSVKDIIIQNFPATLAVGFSIEYDNVPPIRERGTKRVIQ